MTTPESPRSEVERIMREWPEASRAAGVLRVVDALTEAHLMVARQALHAELANAPLRARLSSAEEAHRFADLLMREIYTQINAIRIVPGMDVISLMGKLRDALAAYDAAKGGEDDSVANMPRKGRASDSAEGTTLADPRVCGVSSQSSPPEPPAQDVCVCGHSRTAHSEGGGTCFASTGLGDSLGPRCSCGSFMPYPPAAPLPSCDACWTRHDPTEGCRERIYSHTQVEALLTSLRERCATMVHNAILTQTEMASAIRTLPLFPPEPEPEVKR